MAPRRFAPPASLPNVRHVPEQPGSVLPARSVLVARSSKLSDGAKAGVAVGVIAGVLVLCCFAWPFIARLRRRRLRQSAPYDPAQDDPTQNRHVIPQMALADRRLSVKTAENQQGVAPDPAGDRSKPTSPVDAPHPAASESSPFDPRYPVPPHYQDHPDYLAYQARQAAAARQASQQAAPARVPIDQPSSKLGQLKDNAKNKLLWSVDKAQFLKKAFDDSKREPETGAGQDRVIFDEELESPGTRRRSWFTSLFPAQPAGPSQARKTEGATATTLAPGAKQVLSPAPSRPSASPASHQGEAFEQPGPSIQLHPYEAGRSALPSPPLADHATFDPKHLWHPTTQSERQHSVNHELDMLESGSVSASPQPPRPVEYTASPPSSQPADYTASPSSQPVDYTASPPSSQPADYTASPPSPQPADYTASPQQPQHTDYTASPQQPQPIEYSHPGHLQPSVEFAGPSDPRTPSPQPVFTPETHDTEMVDIGSQFSTPLYRISNENTPASNFTDSEANAGSPKPAFDSEMNSGAPNLTFGNNVAEASDGTPPRGPSSAASPTGPSSVGSPREYRCDECGKTFEQIHRLNHHKRYHERKHECPVEGCNKKFGTKTHLDRHINDKHKKTRKFYCTEPTCPYSIQGGKSFPRKDNWVRHLRKKHRNLSINQDAQGFVVDEETGTAQSVNAPPSQNQHHGLDMGYGMGMGMNMPMSMAQDMGTGMGYGMGNGMHSGLGQALPNGMHNGIPNGMQNGMGMGMGMNMQQPPMPPGAGFNSAWNMGPQSGY